MQKTKSSSSSPEKTFYLQKAKRSSSTSIHPTRPSKGIPGIPATRPSKGIPDIPVIHDIQPLQAILHIPVPPGFPPHYSILQLECIFYIFYTSTGFHKKLHWVPVETLQTLLQTFILQRKGDVAIWVMSETSEILPICQRAVMLYLSETSETLPRCQADINFEIELIPAIVLSSRVTNWKNDIHKFL